jgi:F-type H+-transporting ATPase subunit epsilon
MSQDSGKIQFKIVTPEKVVFSEEVTKLILPTSVGQITILPNHESLIGIIKPGEICLERGNRKEKLFLVTTEGFLEVDKNVVRIFSDAAERIDEMDEKAILKAKKEAEEALKNKKYMSQVAFVEAEARLKKELVKLRVLKKRRKR